MHGLQAHHAFAEEHMSVANKIGWSEKVTAEMKADKQEFLMRQFDLELLVERIEMLSSSTRVANLVVGSSRPAMFIPTTKVFGAGFSCLDFTSQNKKRGGNKGNLRSSNGTSGNTFRSAVRYIQRGCRMCIGLRLCVSLA